jgi:hypothetical protein
MWIETGRGERVRVEVFDFFELSEEWRRWILAERQLEGTKPPPFCKTPFMFRFYEQSRINWFFDDITLFKSLNVTPTNDADYMHCLVKERRAGKKSELPRLIVEVGNNIWTSLMEFLYLKGRGWICPVEDI